MVKNGIKNVIKNEILMELNFQIKNRTNKPKKPNEIKRKNVVEKTKRNKIKYIF